MKFSLLIFIVIFYQTITPTTPILFDLPLQGQRCLKDQVNEKVTVSGTFNIIMYPGSKIDVKITDSSDSLLYKTEDLHALQSEGKFSFTLDKKDVYTICFSQSVPGLNQKQLQNLKRKPNQVTLTTEKGNKALDWDPESQAEQLSNVEFSIKNLESISKDILYGYDAMRKLNAELSASGDITNFRVLYLSLFSMVILVGVAFWQAAYMKKYFIAKRIIEN